MSIVIVILRLLTMSSWFVFY